MSTESQNVELDDQENKQPEKTFDEHVTSLINEFKEKIPEHMDVVIMIKPNESTPPTVYLKGHIYDVTVMVANFVRELKNQIGSQLDC